MSAVSIKGTRTEARAWWWERYYVDSRTALSCATRDMQEFADAEYLSWRPRIQREPGNVEYESWGH